MVQEGQIEKMLTEELKLTFLKKHGNNDEESLRSAPKIGHRHLQVLLYFLAAVIAFGFRIVLSVSIVAMTDPTTNNNTNIPTYPEWKDKNVVLSAFFWGYVIPQLFAGWAANKFSAKWLLIGTFGLNSICGLFVPYMAAHFGSKGVMLCRAVQGLTQGFLFPTLTTLLSHWVPKEERSRLGAFVYSAGSFGTVVSILVTGLICASPYGWPLVYYIYGGLGMCWCILMAVLGSDSPAHHPSISKEEKHFIENSLQSVGVKKRPPTPWKAIVTSKYVISLLIVAMGNNWSSWTLLAQIPSYMKYVMNFDIKNNSILSSLPYIAIWLISILASFVSDHINNNGCISRTTSRRLFNSLGMFLPAVALILLGFTSSGQQTQGVLLLVLAVGLNGLHYSGFTVSPMDLSPNHSGTIVGFVNGFSQITGIISPLVVQLIVIDQKNASQWRPVFLIAAFLNICGAIVYSIWSTAKVQSWNEHHEDDRNIEKRAAESLV